MAGEGHVDDVSNGSWLGKGVGAPTVACRLVMLVNYNRMVVGSVPLGT